MTRWIMLVSAILCEVAGSLSLKAALDNPAWYLVVTIGYVAAFGFLTAAMRAGMGIGVAYGIWGALGVALTAVFSFLIFDEPLTATMMVGLVLIMAGVLLVEFGSQRAQAERDKKIEAVA
ncbi:multidrug efflux SMR transporter [Gordonia sp. Z-3]|uniref:Multidrug efflux SMR transporter n=2 Tax=Gordoniaceae TaxID=85026 RepID=A0A9X3D255_9ACTN|nr:MULTISPECIES: multidrug efflux SMR transporter [Gordonia]MAU82594.1 QacE family quaternary ammonium compound efflux SMR transporter [Gordonia sp. (in: high G+C Gram-positive bacteria)]MCX2963528.1 multidrug efflux SMR transporter [Gordonia aquimaris]MED5803280.1 multidrug efflux SMR transporter [Gordonia sp. Z-3]